MASNCSNMSNNSDISISEFVNKLSETDRNGYLLRLKTTNLKQLPAPFGITEWMDNEKLWPQLEWPSIYTYLIEKPCVYTKESVKVYKSLEAYNYVQNGHVQKVYYANADEDFCFLKAQVLPSQRQTDKSFYDAWVCIHKKDCYIFTASCKCPAG